MKKLLVSTGLLCLLLVACNDGNSDKLKQDSIQIAQLTSDYNEAASFNDSLMLLMGDIYNGLDSINMQEGLLYNLGNGENYDRRAEVRNNLSAIKARLAANKKLLEEMEQRIKASGNETTVLTRTISQMKDHIAQQDARIALIENELEVARDSIVALNDMVAQTQEDLNAETAAKVAAQDAATAAEDQANTVFYAIGTKSELEKNDIIEKKFLRSTKVLRGEFNEAYFTKADKRVLKEIPTNSTKKPKIWTNMPEDSYQIVENADKTYTLKITNPATFWSLSPYLVIEVKK